MAYTLAVNETLEGLRAKLEKLSGRPAIITAGEYGHWNYRYKQPNGRAYKKMKPWDLFLTTLTDRGLCVRRENVVPGDPTQDLYYYDLAPAYHVYICIPWNPDDRVIKDNNVSPLFKAAGIPFGFNSNTEVISPRNEVPEQFDSYYTDRIFRGGRHGWVQGVRFLKSEGIEVPNTVHKKWHIDTLFKGKYTGPTAVLCPPGKYHGAQHGVLESFNYQCMTECDPGKRIVCRGRSGERIHLASMVPGGESAYTTNRICRACTADTFTQWQKLLDKGIPPVLKKES